MSTSQISSLHVLSSLNTLRRYLNSIVLTLSNFFILIKLNCNPLHNYFQLACLVIRKI